MLRTTPEAPPGGGDLARWLAPATAGLAVFAGAALAWDGSARFLLFGDEFHSLRSVELPARELLARYGSDGSSSAWLLLQRLAVEILGPGPRAFRLPAMLAAVGALLLMYPTGARLVGRVPAALATLALALSPLHVYYSHFGRSFSLSVCLGLGLVASLSRAMDRAGPKPVWYGAAALCAGLLPYAHLTAAAFTLAVSLAAFTTLALRPSPVRHEAWLLAAMAAGAALCIALYAPAWEPLWKFIGVESGRGDAREVLSLEALTLLAGSRPAAWVWLVGAPIAATWLCVRRGGEAVLLVVAAVGMPIGLLLARPMGDVYATARWLLIGLPYLLMLLFSGLVAAVRCLGLPRTASRFAEFAAGVALVAICTAAGPLVGRGVERGPFGASPFRLAPLPAFDARWPGEPDFYATLAQEPGPLRIVEAPALTDQAVALYRNYALRHGHEVLQAIVSSEVPPRTRGGTLRLSEVDASRADYLVLHLDIASEVERYWRYVYRDVWQPDRAPERAAFMAAQRVLGIQPPPASRRSPKLRRRLGEPVYRDRDIVVWKLAPQPRSGTVSSRLREQDRESDPPQRRLP